MRWHCLQHVPFEGPGHLASWVQRRGHILTRTELWREKAFPNTDDYDGLFILGGPMNVFEFDKYPWLAPEERFIARAICERKPVLGVCLGAQLLSVILGGSVTKNVDSEFGWLPVDLTPSGHDSSVFRNFPDRFVAFHWHGDRFSIPPRAVHAARSEACEQQAFTYENHVVGLQFHLESDEPSIEAVIRHCGEEMGCRPYIQDANAIAGSGRYLPATHELLERLLDNLV